jgi:Fe-S cluster assembly protein SufB
MSQAELDKLIRSNYEAGFTTTVDTETLPPGLSEEVIRFLSAK